MKTLQAPPKLAVINDVAGYGRCSTLVSIPVISVLGVQACLVPTAFFSNHTGFPTWHFDDYTEQMPEYLNAWQKLSLNFDGIYVGFLGSDAQIDIVESFLLQHPESKVLIDPVLGDHGKTYSTVTDRHCTRIRDLVKRADIITPNITEACLLTDTPFKESGWKEAELSALATKLHALGPKKAVITGICGDDCLINFYYEVNTSDAPNAPLRTGLIQSPIAGEFRHGTGDIFASILAADALKQIPFADSVKKAASFISTCIAGSDALQIPLKEGVCFENYLSELLP